MPGGAEELTPEDCYARALDHLTAGRTERAITLLQVAALKAPHASRYREALREAEALLAEAPAPDLALDPEALLAEAQAILANGGDTDKALKLLKIARAKAPSEPRYREALEALQRSRQPAPAPAPAAQPASTLERQGERLSQAAAADLERTDATTAESAARAGAPARSILLPLLLILVVSMGLAGVVTWRNAAQRVPIAPSQELLPGATSARAEGSPLRNELILTVPAAAWAALPAASREATARSLLRRAQQDDFMIVYIYSPEQRLLATAHPERVYLPE